MWVDLPPVTSAEIWSEFQKPLSQEVVSVWFCKSPDFQKQFDELQTQTKEKTAKLQEEMQYSEKQKEVLRKIYQSLWDDNPELKKAIENQSVKIFEVPWRDLVALSIDGKNVDFIYWTNGEIFRNYKIKRENLWDYLILLSMSDIKEKLLIDWKLISLEDFIKQGHKNIPEDTKIIIVSEEWKELNTFSNESLTKYAEWWDYLDKMTETLKWVIEIWDEK